MLLQAITIDDARLRGREGGALVLNELIFPGGCLPSLEVIARLRRRARPTCAWSASRTSPRSYPPTLRRWREHFLAAADELEALGYDRRFRRLWELYFAYSEGGFRERRIGDVQMLLAKPAYRGLAR